MNAAQEATEAPVEIASPVVDLFGKQVAMGALALFFAMTAGVLIGKDLLGSLVLLAMAMGLFCLAVRIQD
jgi:hypothetical protein